MQTLQIEPLQELRSAEWQELIQTSVEEGYEFVQRLWDEYQAGINRFDEPGAVLLGGYLNDELIAIGGLHPDPYLNKATIGRIRHVYVLPEHRRSGIGRALVQALIEQAHTHYAVLTLRTLTAHGDGFYRSLGFTDAARFEQATHWLEIKPTR